MTKNEQLQSAFHSFEGKHGHLPMGAREASEWAVSEGILQAPEIDPLDILADQMATALRSEYKTDEKGRRYRVNHAVRVTRSGVQYTFWGVLGFAEHDFMEKAFAQRREQVIGDCTQLKTDVDVYNDLNLGKRPEIQLVLDFSDDVAERQIQNRPAKIRQTQAA
jgi:hypothetical protein